MDSEDSTSTSPEKMPLLETCFDSSYNLEQSILDIGMKDEPLDITDDILNEISIKDESEDSEEIDVCSLSEPKTTPDNNKANLRADVEVNINITEAPGILFGTPNKNINTVSNAVPPVTRIVTINGQAKTCILINNTQMKKSIISGVEKAKNLKFNSPSPSKTIHKDISNALVKCSRCCSDVYMDNFRQHIDVCPPRRPGPKKACSVKGNAGQNQYQSVQVIYNPSTGEVATLNNDKINTSFRTSDMKVTESSSESRKEVNTNFQHPPKTSYQASPVVRNNLHLNKVRTNIQSPQSNISDYLLHSGVKSHQERNVSQSILPSFLFKGRHPKSVLRVGLPSKNTGNLTMSPFARHNLHFQSARKDVQSSQSKTTDYLLHSDAKSPQKRTVSESLLPSFSSKSKDPKSILPLRLPSGNSGTLTNKKNKLLNDSQNAFSILLRCNKCDFTSAKLIIMEIHMKRHLNEPTMSSTPSPGQNNKSVSKAPLNENISCSQNIEVVTDVSPKISESCSSLASNAKEITAWKYGAQQASKNISVASNSDEVLYINDRIVVVHNELLNPNKSTSKSLSMDTNTERKHAYSENLNNQDDDSQTSLTDDGGTSDKATAEVNNLEEAVILGSSTSNVNEITAWKDGAQQDSENVSIASNSDEVLYINDRINVIHNELLNPNISTSKSLSMETNTEIKHAYSENLNNQDDDSQTSLTDDGGTSDKATAEGNNLEEAVILGCENSLKQCNNDLTSENLDNSLDITTRKTRSKSVCATKFPEVTDETPPQRIGTRSKSISTDRAAIPSNLASEFSPRRTRSQSVYKDTFILDQESIDSKISQNVPGGVQKSKNAEASENKDEKTKNLDKGNDSTENSSDGQPAVESGSNSFVQDHSDAHPSIYSQKSTSDSIPNSLDCSLTNRTNLSDNDEIASKTSVHSISNPNMSVNSNFESVVDNIHVASRDEDSPYSEQPLVESSLLQDSTFSCSICSFTTDRKIRLKDHERNHRKNNLAIFRCVYCSQKYTRYMLYFHVQNVHPGQKFQIRDEELDEAKSEMVKDADKLSDVQPTKTNQEPAKSNIKNTLVKRIAASDRHMFKCELCSYSSPRITKMTAHRNSHKNNWPIKKCPRCEFKSTPKALLFHMKICRKKFKAALRHHQCNLCSHATTSGRDLARHMNTHLKNMPIKECENCEFKSTEKSLKSHSIGCNKNRLEEKTVCLETNNADTNVTFENSNEEPVKLNIMNPVVKQIAASNRHIFKCKLCSYSSSFITKMTEHRNCHKNNRPIKQCPRCEFKSTPNALWFHMKICKKSKPALKQHPCNICSYALASRADLIRHVNTHSKNKPIKKCENCEFKSTEKPLKIHSIDCNKNRLVEERVCSESNDADANVTFDKNVSNKEPVKLNIMNPVVKQIAASNRHIFKCKLCSYSSSYITKMKAHRNCHKNNRPINQCPRCEFKSTPNALLLHMKMCKKKSKPALRHHQCNLCSHASTCRSNLIKHMNTHLKNMPIKKCENCEFKSTAHSLKIHSINCNKNRLVEETVCSESNDADTNVTVDKNVSNEESVKLNIMNPVVKQIAASNRHIFKCKLCSYSSSLITKMTAHNNCHKNNRPIKQCPRCEFKSTPNALLFHMKMCKKKSKPALRHHQCNLCSHASMSGRDLMRHMNTHLKNKPIKKCDNCEFKSTAYSLTLHSIVCNKNRFEKKTVRSRTNNADTIVTFEKKISSEEVNDQGSSAKSVLDEELKTKPTSSFKCSTIEQVKSLACNNLLKRTDQSGRILLNCKMCSYETINQVTLLQHINAHKNNLANIKCPYCNFKSTPFAVRHHSQKCKENPKYAISSSTETQSEFNEVLKDINQKKLVVKIEPPKVLFRCSKCPFASLLRIKLKLHIRKRHLELQGVTNNSPEVKKSSQIPLKSGPKSYKCKLCPFVTFNCYAYSSHMRIHKRAKVSAVMNFKDDNNQIEQNTPHSETEKSISRKKPAERITQKVLKCNLCSFVGTRYGSFMLHIKSHRLKIPIRKCRYCNFRSTPTPLRRHICENRKEQTTVSVRDDNKHADYVPASTNSKDDNKQIEQNTPHSEIEKSSSRKKPAEDITQKVLKCNLCSFVGGTRYGSFMLHIKSHRLKMPIRKCRYCNFRSTPTPLRRHICDNRKDQTTVSVKDDNKHADNVSASPNFKDDNKQIEQNTPHSEIEKSSSRKKPAEDITQKVLKCNLCSFVGTRYGSFMLHIKSHRLKMPIRKCRYCNFRSTPTPLMRHICENRKKETTMSVRDDNKHADNNVSTPTNSKNDDKQIKPNTLDSETQESTFQCPLCPFSACLRIKLNFHTKKYHEQANRPSFKNSKAEAGSNEISKNINGKARRTESINKNTQDISQNEPKTLSSVSKETSILEIGNGNRDGKNKIPGSDGKKIFKNSPRIWACILCSYTSRIKSNLPRHIQSHKKFPTVQCPNCSFRALPISLALHLSKCVSSKDDCEVSKIDNNKVNKPPPKVIEKKDLPQTMTVKDSIHKSFKCQYCSFTSFCSYLIERHMNSHTLLKLPNQQCEKCEFRSTPIALWAHRNTCFGNPQHASEMTNNSDSDQDNINEERQKITESTGKSKNKLQTGLDMSTASDVSRQANSDENTPYSNSPNIVFSCPKCPFSTHLRIRLKIHLKKEHLLPNTIGAMPPPKLGRKLIKCKYCSHMCRKSVIRRHEATHTVYKRPISKCLKCDFKSTKYTLRHHEFKCFRRAEKESKLDS